MTTKTLTGTYSAGYTLSARYSELQISATASIGGAGLVTSAPAIVVNNGDIAAGQAIGGVGAISVDLAAGGVVINYDVIKGGNGDRYNPGGVGGIGVDLAAGGTVINHGLIKGGNGGRYSPGGVGAYLTNGASLVNNGAIVGGGAGGAGGVGGAGAYLYYGDSVSNAGSIIGGGGSGYGSGGDGMILRFGEGASSGLVWGGRGGSEGGLANGSDGGVGIRLQASDFQNQGRIFGGKGGYGPNAQGGRGGDGVSMKFGQDLGNTLTNTGTIAGGLGGMGAGGGGGGGVRGFGVYADGGNIVNGSASAPAALILGYAGVYARAESGFFSYATTLTNYGTIEGTGGAAVLFGSTKDRLIVGTGAVFVGYVKGGGGTLEFVAGKGALEGLGGQFTSFAAYDVDPAGRWVLGGTTAADAIFSIAARGNVAVGAAPLTVRGAVNNNGRLETLRGDLTVDGAVTGTGDVVIDGGVADFAAGFSQTVWFGALGGNLELADSQAFGGSVHGFSNTGATSLDLRDIGFVGAGEATFSGTATGGVLTVTDGTHTAQIHLAGDFLGSSFTASSDGKGGVVVVDPTAPATPAPVPATLAGAVATSALPTPLAIRTLTGTYASGYSLSANYSALVVDPSAVIGGQAGASGAPGEYATVGGIGGAGITIGFPASVTNAGAVTGGAGGVGGYSQYVSGAGKLLRAGAGGAGGVGLSLAPGSRTINSGTVTGGPGGAGGTVGETTTSAAGVTFYCGDGGGGGDGVKWAVGGQMINRGWIIGGEGGAGGSSFVHPSYGGTGGQGGAGVYLSRIGAINNLGTILGGAGGLGGTSRYYSGDGGVGGAGVDLGGGGRLFNAGLVLGGEGGGAGNYRASAGAGGAGVLLASRASLANTGTIIGGAGGRGDALAASGGVGVNVAAGGRLQNSGAILGGAGGAGTYGSAVGVGGVGVYLAAGGGLTVAGQIGGGAGGLAEMVKNLVVRGGLGGAGVKLGAGASLTCMGVITGGVGGQGVAGGAGVYLMNGASLSNSGTVTGGQGGQYDPVNGGQGGAGVYVYDGGGVFNTGSITGGAGGQSGPRYAGVQGGAGVVLRFGDGYSSGVITGGQGGATGGAGGAGVALSGLAYFHNSGRIAGGQSGVGYGVGGNGVGLNLGETLVNTGTIVGGLGGAANRQGDGVSAAGGSIVNGGVAARGALIAGEVGIYVAALSKITVTNFGTIEGAGGVAVELGGTMNRLIVEAGAVFDGAVRGGGGVLEFAAGKAALKGLGVAFSGFGAYQIDAGGVWALSGTVTAGATLSIAAKGALVEEAGAALTLQGAVVNDGVLAPYQGDLTVDGAVAGAGVVVINGGTASFASSFSQATRFGAAGGKLELGDSPAFQAVVYGFSTKGATTFDLRDIGFSSANEATFSGTTTRGVLTVTDGTHTARITLAGDYVGSTFVTSSDGGGGVMAVDQGASPPHEFVAAMAGMGARAPATMVHSPPALPVSLSILVQPVH